MAVGINRYGSPESIRSHLVAAMIAGGLSLVLHVALLVYVSDLELMTANPTAADREQQRPASAVEQFELIPKRPLDQSSSADKGFGDKDIAEELGLSSDRAESMTKPADPVTIEPPAVTADGLDQGVGRLPDPPERIEPWQPRRAILEVEYALVDDSAALLPRDIIPLVERVADTPDYIPPFEMTALRVADPQPFEPAGGMVRPAPVEDVAPVAQGDKVTLPTEVVTDAEDPVETSPDKFEEPREVVSASRPLEQLLTAQITSASVASEPAFTYFRVRIDRLASDKLPVIPKDVLLVQDSSESMSPDRLHFCIKALSNCLNDLNAADRFNVISFAEQPLRCFEDWREVSKDAVREARKFIAGMSVAGETDIYAALREMERIPKQPGRPVIVLLVTDGRPTVGTLQSSRIIGEFTKQNRGRVSVFTLGTSKSANWYLLDQLSYCNRGEADAVKGGRWGIPEAFERISASVASPVMDEVRFIFDEKSGGEIYPFQTMNLYEGRPLIVYGRCSADVSEVAFQARGMAGDVPCDMIFKLDLRPQRSVEGEELRKLWAEQKVYSLIGMQALDPTDARQRLLRATAGEYGIPLPYGKIH